jgi:hypothetical protein
MARRWSERREGELPSEGTMAGALQIPPAGLPVLFLADHPITGGYPVIGVVRDEHLDRRRAGPHWRADPIPVRSGFPGRLHDFYEDPREVSI